MAAGHPGAKSGRRFAFTDKDGNVYRVIGEAERTAINLAGERVCRRYTCMVTAEKPSPRLLGSGTIVAIGDDLFVATARHLFDDHGFDDEVRAWWGESDERLFAVAIEEPTGDLDLAAIHLGARSQAGRVMDGVSLDQIDLQIDDCTDDLMVVCGVPDKSFTRMEELRTIWIEHWSQGLIQLPRERWPDLRPPATREQHLVLHYSNELALDRHGKRMPAVDPHGLSGGGIWRVGLSSDGIWTPENARLVGILESVERDDWRWLCATRIRHWLQLVWDEWPSTRDAIRNAWPDFETTS